MERRWRAAASTTCASTSTSGARGARPRASHAPTWWRRPRELARASSEAEAHERFRSADAHGERARKGAASAVERGTDGRVAQADGEVGIPAVLDVLVAVG